MTKTEAVRNLLAGVMIQAKVIDQNDAYRFDQSPTNYIPDPHDLAMVEAIVGRKISEEELQCHVGLGPLSTRFSLTSQLLSEVRLD
jgi:hypothetical protein